MNKTIIGLLLVSFIFTASGYYGSTTAPVILAGGIIKAKSIDETHKKYKRKDCPVCLGKGWYMSGDKIKKIECSYCEEDRGTISVGNVISINPTVPYKCDNSRCKPSQNIRR